MTLRVSDWKMVGLTLNEIGPFRSVGSRTEKKLGDNDRIEPENRRSEKDRRPQRDMLHSPHLHRRCTTPTGLAVQWAARIAEKSPQGH